MKEYQKNQKSNFHDAARVLVGHDWGIKEEELEKCGTGKKDLKQLRNHWVPTDQYEQYKQLLDAKAVIIRSSNIAALIGLLLLLYSLTIWNTGGANEVPIANLIVSLGATALIASAIGLRWYVIWSYWLTLSLFIIISLILLLIIPIVLLDSLHSLYEGSWFVAIGVLLHVILLGITIIATSRLARKSVRRIFESDIQSAISDLHTPNHLSRISAYGAIIIVVIGLIGHTYFSLYPYMSPEDCDQLAKKTSMELGKSLNWLLREIEKTNCDKITDSLASDLKLEYLLGPYYGWKGTPQNTQVYVRIVDDKICACSPMGRMFENGGHYIYRVSVKSAEQLSTIKGECLGKAYGGLGSFCYTSTMIGEDCTIRRPAGVVGKCYERFRTNQW